MSMAQVSTSRQRRFAAGESRDGRHPAEAGQAVTTPHHRPAYGRGATARTRAPATGTRSAGRWTVDRCRGEVGFAETWRQQSLNGGGIYRSDAETAGG
jgi:hypothetical protein